jgi:hypothetical protein
LVGVGESDAVATPAPSDNVVVEADVSVTGGEGGIVARAVSTKSSFQGVSLMLIPGSGGPAHAVLRVSDGAGTDANLGQPVEITGLRSHVKLSVKGSEVEAAIGAITLKGVMPPGLAHGDVAIRAHAGATVEVADLTVRKR